MMLSPRCKRCCIFGANEALPLTSPLPAYLLSECSRQSCFIAQVIRFLNQTIDWYRHVTVEQQSALDPKMWR